MDIAAVPREVRSSSLEGQDDGRVAIKQPVLCFPSRRSSSAIPGRSPRRFMIRKIPIMGFTIGVRWGLMFG
jgi:hypothetical protein